MSLGLATDQEAQVQRVALLGFGRQKKVYRASATRADEQLVGRRRSRLRVRPRWTPMRWRTDAAEPGSFSPNKIANRLLEHATPERAGRAARNEGQKAQSIEVRGGALQAATERAPARRQDRLDTASTPTHTHIAPDPLPKATTDTGASARDQILMEK